MIQAAGWRWGLRALVAWPLLAAGVLKASEPVTVIDQTALTWIAPALVGPAFAVLPWIEIAVAVWLLAEAAPRAAAAVAAFLAAAFLAVTGWRLAVTGWSPDCGCFGALRTPLDWWHLLGTVVLLLASLWLCWRPQSRQAGP